MTVNRRLVAINNLIQIRRRQMRLQSGGGTTPAWLPEGAVAYADFAAGNFYGGSETTSATLFDDIDPADVSASGLAIRTATASRPIGTAALIASFNPTDFTLVIEFTYRDEVSTFYSLLLMSDGTNGIDIGYDSTDTLFASEWGGPYDAVGDVVAGTNRIAITVDGGDVHASLNGAAVVTNASVNALSALTDLQFGWNFDGDLTHGLIQKIEFYAAVADAALPALSAL